MTKMNRQWRLRHRPAGDLKQGDLQFVTEPVPALGPNQFLVRNIYLSLDPTNRIWMSDMDQYMPPVQIGDVMRGGTLGVVEASNNPGFKVGEIVQPFLGGWQDYVVAEAAQPVPRGPLPLTAFMSVMGMTGATAYFGLLDVGKPKAGETVVVSAAAGAVGSIVGQIAKLKGCRVVGLAGSDEKCRHVVDHLGFDACINYKTENVLEALRRECPNGIDVDFENVGGEILDAVLTLINDKARIVLCGLISSYNADKPVPGPYMFRNILMKKARVEGFIIIEYLGRMGEFIADMSQWLAEGKIKWDVDLQQGLEHAPAHLQRLFTGANTGKLIVQIGPEP